MQKQVSNAEQLLFIAEHVAQHELPHTDSKHRDYAFAWSDKAGNGTLLSVNFNLAGKKYMTHQGSQDLLVPDAAIGIYDDHGGGASMVVRRNKAGNATRIPGSNDFSRMILDEFIYFPYYQEADLLFSGLAKLQNRQCI